MIGGDQMTLRHLQILRAVADNRSFTKAAAQLYITQSAVSHAIKELEEMAGTALFDRTSKKVCLTACGRLLLQESLPVLSSCESLEKRMKELEKDTPVRLASSITIAGFWLPGIIRKIQEKHPGIRTEVEVVSASNAVKLLEKGEVDAALIEGVIPEGPYESFTFDSYSLRAVCAPGYLHEDCDESRKSRDTAGVEGSPRQKTISPSALCREKLLLRERGSAIRDAFDSAMLLKGCTAHPVWVSVNSQALIEAARAGLGITFLPDILVEKEMREGSLAEIQIEGISLKNELHVIYHKDKYLTVSFQELLLMIKSISHPAATV